MGPGDIDVRRAADRFRTVADGIESWHCFSFGQHYDPANTSFGPLVALNDETLQPGSRFAPHRHAGIDIVTWVVSGSLEHEDPTGERRLRRGVVQLLSAGSGVVHAEGSPPPLHGRSPAGEATRFIQMWITPDEPGGEPRHAERPIDADALGVGYVVVASGRPRHRRHTAVTVGRAGAALLATRLAQGQSVELPDARLVHLFVVRGAVELETGELLLEGDSARMRSVGRLRIESRSPAEILVWEFDEPPSA